MQGLQNLNLQHMLPVIAFTSSIDFMPQIKL